MSALPTAQQRGLKSFIVYSKMPHGCIAFADDRGDCFPHVSAGEMVVIDPNDREPVAGEIFLIEWQSSFAEDRRCLVGMFPRTLNVSNGSDQPGDPAVFWFMGGTRRKAMMTLKGQPVGQAFQWVDGPYSDEQVEKRMIGKVVGIFQPDSAGGAA